MFRAGAAFLSWSKTFLFTCGLLAVSIWSYPSAVVPTLLQSFSFRCFSEQHDLVWKYRLLQKIIFTVIHSIINVTSPISVPHSSLLSIFSETTNDKRFPELLDEEKVGCENVQHERKNQSLFLAAGIIFMIDIPLKNGFFNEHCEVFRPSASHRKTTKRNCNISIHVKIL